jgi:hypothetical protein
MRGEGEGGEKSKKITGWGEGGFIEAAKGIEKTQTCFQELCDISGRKLSL